MTAAVAVHAMRLVFLGPPGAGKGTQAQILVRRFGARQISTGDILRDNVFRETALGRRAKPYTEAGTLVPDDVIVAMMEDELGVGGAFILDGFPRTVAQAEALDAMLARLALPLTAVLLFDADRPTLIDRLTGRWTNPRTGRTYHDVFNPPRVPQIDDEDGGPLVQRPDDARHVIAERLATYDEKTKPLIDYYERCGLLQRIDGLQPIETVRAAILETLGVTAAQAAMSETDQLGTQGAAAADRRPKNPRAETDGPTVIRTRDLPA
ncbi:MAG: adenylate kinase [Candidatus Eremiobacteraeota bacterium]|nr:adenylate kinase [Candidatus Eremiobacteraeota bacterium]